MPGPIEIQTYSPNLSLIVWEVMKIFAHLIIASAIAHAVMLSVAFATHEVDHRYNVTGYVLDANEVPLADKMVEIRMNNRLVGSAETDAEGFYNIQLHLHDEDLNKELEVQAADNKATIQVTFTRGDKSTKRVHYANFLDGKLIEGRLGSMGFPLWGYGVVGLLGAVPVAMLIRRRTRRVATTDARSNKPKRQRKRKRQRRK